MTKIVLAVILLFSISATSNAGVIQGAVSVSLSGSGGTAQDINNIIQNGGTPPYVNGVTDFAAYTTDESNTPSFGAAFIGTDTTTTFTFDLGSEFLIAGFGLNRAYAIFGGNLASGDLRFSTTGLFTGSAATSFTFPSPFTSAATTSQHAFPSVTARYIEFTNLGLADATLEMRFDEVWFDDVTQSASVPAPATLALFGLGLAGLGWSRRKKA